MTWPFDDDRPGALDAARRSSGAIRNAQFHTAMVGADNLLDKAARALREGDEQRATRLIDRAAAMEWDDREERFPGVAAAEMLLFTLVTDVLEDSDEDEHQWLDAALDVMATGGVGAELLADALYAIGEGSLDYYDLTPVEHRRLLAGTGTRPLDPDHGMVETTPAVDRAALIRGFVETANAYAARLRSLA